MKTFTATILRSSLTLGIATLIGLAASACDLPDKNLGDDPPGETDGVVCEDGETMMDDCNTCTCEDGGWSCTEIGCTDGSGDGGMSCNPEDLPMPQCGECSCEDGEWVCSAIGCEPECVDGEMMMDGCSPCICEDGGWSCEDIGCLPSPVAVCDGSEPDDALFITDAFITEDLLTLTAEFSGGCGTHEFGSCWDQSFAESEPVQATVNISHASDDPCEAIESDTLEFDLTPVREAYVASYGPGSGTIDLSIPGFGGVAYNF